MLVLDVLGLVFLKPSRVRGVAGPTLGLASLLLPPLFTLTTVLSFVLSRPGLGSRMLGTLLIVTFGLVLSVTLSISRCEEDLSMILLEFDLSTDLSTAGF